MRNPLKRLPSEQVDGFARSLAEAFESRYPLAMHTAVPRKKKAERSLTDALTDACDRARVFHGEHRLRIYDKARLGNTFRWELCERGYDAEFADEIVRSMMVESG